MVSRLAILACLASGLLAAPERPEAGLSCPRTQGLFSHPTDCHLFLHCDHNYPYVKECPANLHFNAKLMVCDWPENAGCTGGTPTDPPPPDVDPEPSVECDCECCLKPVADDCTSYYMCKDGKAYKESCSAGLVFNPNTDNCDLASNYKCDVPTTTNRPVTTKSPATTTVTTTTRRSTTTASSPKTTKTTTASPSADFDCPESSGLFPNPKDCHTFYHCSNGYAYLKDCPDNLEFNPTLLVCDWPQNAGCSIKTTTLKPTNTTATTTNPTTTTQTHGFECPESNGLFPNTEDCHTFYHCSNGHAYLKDCPANLEFNPVLLICDWPENAGCNGKSTPSPKPTLSTTPEPKPNPDVICPNDTCVCRLPDPENCACFYQCDKGGAFRECCSTGLHFNKDTEVCDLPENVDCEEVTTPSPTSTTAKPPPPPPCTFPCTKSDGVYGNPLNVGTYFECSGGQATIHYCPSDKLFDAGTNSCDAPGIVVKL